MKIVVWVADTLNVVRALPKEVRAEIGFALRMAQDGGKALHAVPMGWIRGAEGGKIIDIHAQHRGSAYRAIYSVKFPRAVYVLHVLQKKSTCGIGTPKRHIRLIEQRFRDAEFHYKKYFEAAVHNEEKSHGHGA